MNSFYRGIMLCMLASTASGDDSTVRLHDFKSQLARTAVKTYTDRIVFLQQRMQEHVETATKTLRESLKAALEQAAKDGELEETERISKFLQADATPSGDKIEFKQFANFHPVIVIEQTVDGETDKRSQIVLQADGTILTSDPNLSGSWTLRDGSLKLTWRSRNGVVIDSNTLNEDRTNFSGTNNHGRRLSGRVLLGSFESNEDSGKQ